jgi:hypothetical protein
MVLPSSSWDFSDSVGHHRLDLLNNPPPFEEIAQSIATLMRIQCSHPDPCDEADGYRRLVVCLEINRPLFDLFFNSCNGYRGWYYRSPTDGVRINEKLLQLLAPQLAEFQTHDDMLIGWALKSLLASSAKCWLAEVGKGFCSKCEGDWTKPKDNSPEILNGRWELAEMPKSRFGRKAPYLERLRVIGGFVDHTGKQYVVEEKINRAQEICDVGWS